MFPVQDCLILFNNYWHWQRWQNFDKHSLNAPIEQALVSGKAAIGGDARTAGSADPPLAHPAPRHQSPP